EVLKHLNIQVRYVSTHRTYDKTALTRHHPEGAILLCGGGNFGDIYPDEASLRNRILEDFPDRKIIQLPQRIWFSSDAAAAPTEELFERTSNFTLLVREKASLDRATNLLSQQAILCPDMALALEADLAFKETSSDICSYRFLKRDDGE